MFPEIDQQHFARIHATGAVVIDVRDPDEYHAGHVPAARLLPLGEITRRAGELPTDRPVYVICQAGGRSAQATELMRAVGIDATSVTGGTGAWIESGRPVATAA